MGYSKDHLFPPPNQILANLFKALSHPSRLEILEVIPTYDECRLIELEESIPLGKSSIRNHLMHLRQMQIVVAVGLHDRLIYRVNKTEIDSMIRYLEELKELSREKRK